MYMLSLIYVKKTAKLNFNIPILKIETIISIITRNILQEPNMKERKRGISNFDLHIKFKISQVNVRLQLKKLLKHIFVNFISNYDQEQRTKNLGKSDHRKDVIFKMAPENVVMRLR